MAYQPLYARVTDNQGGCGHTLSLRGKVDDIGIWVNTYDGSAINVSSSYCDGKEYVNKPDLRTIPKKERKKVKENYDKEVAEKTEYNHRINLTRHKNHSYSINGYKLTEQDFEYLEKCQKQEFAGMLGIVGAFGLIPDIKNIVDSKTDKERKQAIEIFKGKKDKLTEIINEIEV